MHTPSGFGTRLDRVARALQPRRAPITPIVVAYHTGDAAGEAAAELELDACRRAHGDGVLPIVFEVVPSRQPDEGVIDPP